MTEVVGADEITPPTSLPSLPDPAISVGDENRLSVIRESTFFVGRTAARMAHEAESEGSWGAVIVTGARAWMARLGTEKPLALVLTTEPEGE